MTDYTSIDCGLHSQFELAIMRKEHLQLSWQEPKKEKQSQLVKPIDLIAKNHEEFLLIEDKQGERLEIRLDYIDAL